MEIAETTIPSTTTAQAPFHGYKRPDVVLRTSDSVDFYVHKLVLSLASAFFEQMFSLTQPDPQTNLDVDPDPDTVLSLDGTRIPIIPLTEDSQTIDYLLRLCYPVTDPTASTDLATVAKILEAAMKYELEEATALLKVLFVTFIGKEPLKVYAISCRLRLEHEAGVAAQKWRTTRPRAELTRSGYSCQTVPHSMNGTQAYPCDDPNCRHRSFQDTLVASSYVAEMKDISAGCYFRLLRHVRTDDITHFCDPPPETDTLHPSMEEAATTPSPLMVDPNILTYYPADIVLKSSDGKLIHTHQIHLAFASASTILAKARDPTCPVHEGLPLVDLEEGGDTLIELLRICLPLRAGDITDELIPFERARSVWAAAKKYEMLKVMEVARRDWMDHLVDSPIKVYFTALKLGWMSEAKEAALYSTRHTTLDEGGYVPEMEYSSAETLYRLYRYQFEHRKAGADILARYQHSEQSSTSTTAVDQESYPKDIPFVAAPLVIRNFEGYYGSHISTIVSDLANESRALIRDFRDAVSNIHLEILDDANPLTGISEGDLHGVGKSGKKSKRGRKGKR